MLYVCANDLAGNTSTRNGTYRLDKTAPYLTGKTTYLGTRYTGNQTSTFYYADT